MPRQDLCICKLNELESTIIEITNPKKKQILSLVVYIDIQQWTSISSMIEWQLKNTITKNIKRKEKCFFVLGDFNVDLL